MTTQKTELMPDEYYLQNKHAGFLGNAPTWWAKGGNGYTAYILGAERFSYEAAAKYVLQDPDKFAMYRCADIDARLHLVFDSQDFNRLGTDEPCGWRSGYAAPVSTDLYTTACAERDALKSKVNAAYTERMQVVLMLAKMSGCNYGVGKDDNENWEDEWRNVVYIDLPQGQVSWHIAPHDMHLFEGFPAYNGKWDGTFNSRSADFAKSVSDTERDALRALCEGMAVALSVFLEECQFGGMPPTGKSITAAEDAIIEYLKHKAGE